MTPMRPRAITLDLDDTLWPVRPVLIAAEQALSDWLAEQAPRTHGWLTPEARKRLRLALLAEHPGRAHDVSFLRRESLRRALTAAGDDPALAEPAFEVFLDARQRVRLYDDVLPVLRAWADRVPLVALSNGNADIRRIGLDGLFHARVSAHGLGAAKPDPRIFEHACRQVGTEPAETLHVGDDLHLDVRGARAAGLRAAWVLRPDIAATHAADPSRDPTRDPASAGEAVFASLQAVAGHFTPDWID